jgi:putative ABC transport system ATP-binding protein
MQTDVDKGIAARCVGVTKTFGKGDTQVVALRGVDLDIRQGELLMLVGPSGCGKTTLISIVAAILDKDAGQCDVLGHDVAHMARNDKVRFRGKSIGFVFQIFNLLPSLTALENVEVPLLLNGISRKSAEERARFTLDSVGLGERVDAYPAELSGGQQQRVAIARALVHNPELIICDEPTSNLDHKAGQDMMTILRDVARNPDRALIIVTHDPRILGFADRIAYMDDGRITKIVTGNGQVSVS